MSLLCFFRPFLADEQAQGVSENGLLLAIVAVGSLVAIMALSGVLEGIMNRNAGAISDALSSVQ